MLTALAQGVQRGPHQAVKTRRSHMNRHRLARSAALGLALAALAAATASADTVDLRSPDARDAARPAAGASQRHDMRSPDTRDVAEGRGSFNRPEVVVVKAQPQTRPALTNGIDWADVGIGAGGMLGMILLALASILAVVHRRQSAAAAQPATRA
jgi:hypothetical protein